MRMLTIQGRVVADAQVKSTVKGTAYITFRFANNEFNDKEDSTFWMNVRSFDPSHINLAKFITKGKPLTLVGNYSNKVYAAKDGTCQVDNDLVLTAIYFDNVKREGDQTAATQTTTVAVTNTEPVTVAPTPTPAAPKTKKKTKPKVVAPTVVTDNEDDDLPF